MSSSRLILVVDDDEDVREALVDALVFEGYAVEWVPGGQEGMDWLHAHHGTSSLVLLDLMMPVMSGRAFLDLKDDDPELAAVPVIVLTAGGDCRELKASGRLAHCLSKTAPLQELVAAIESYG